LFPDVVPLWIETRSNTQSDIIIQISNEEHRAFCWLCVVHWSLKYLRCFKLL